MTKEKEEPMTTPQAVAVLPPVPAIYRALTKIYGDLRNPRPKGYNNQQNFAFVSFGQLTDPIRKSCANHGVFIESRVDQVNTKEIKSNRGSVGTAFTVKMTFRFTAAEDASFVETEFFGESQDFGDKGLNKAYTACMKQALMKTFLISTGDDDPDAHQPEEVTTEPPIDPQEVWNKENKRFHALTGNVSETARVALCRMVGVSSFSEVGVGDLMGFNEKMNNIDAKSREIGLMKFINKFAPDLVEEEAAKGEEE